MDEIRTVIIGNKKIMLNKNAYDEYIKLKKENQLLKEELKELKEGITGIYNNMNALEIINKKELEEDIEEI